MAKSSCLTDQRRTRKNHKTFDMKHIICAAVKEEAVFKCDDCNKPAVSHFEINFGYGSDFDLEFIEDDFCNDCSNEFRKYILKKYKKISVRFLL